MLLLALALANALPAAEPPQHRRKARARVTRVTSSPARAALSVGIATSAAANAAGFSK